jgi:hypothetical protein
MPTEILIESIRQEIAIGRCPTANVLRLCERAEELIESSLRMEKALHETIKIIERNKT